MMKYCMCGDSKEHHPDNGPCNAGDGCKCVGYMYACWDERNDDGL